MKKTGKRIGLKVAWHVSGNRTLMKSIDGVPQGDLKRVFFCNSDSAEFYRAAAKLIANLARQGHQIVYEDTKRACDTPSLPANKIARRA